MSTLRRSPRLAAMDPETNSAENVAARKAMFAGFGWTTQPEAVAVVISPAELEQLAEPEPDTAAMLAAVEAGTARMPRVWPPVSAEVEATAQRSRVARSVKLLPAEEAHEAPYNRVTGVEYRGGNIMRLMLAEAEHGWEASRGWAGFHQWISVGRVVRKGEHGTKAMTVVTVEDGKTKPRGFVVFHYDQTEPLEG